MSNRIKFSVWQYGKSQGEKAYCDLCDENSNNVLVKNNAGVSLSK